ncbi:MAG: Uma2 family endonuclease [Gemmatimonadaceae bacterium]
MADVLHYWTPDDVRALPDDGNRYECIGGVLLVAPTPRPVHQFAVDELSLRLRPYVRGQSLGDVIPLAADLELSVDALTQPDLFVLPGNPRRDVRKWSDVKRALLVVEVLSPSTARYDRGLKRHFYQRAPVEEYWIVDIDARVIERWRVGDERPEVLGTTLEWQPAGASAAFTLDVQDYFGAVMPDGR